ncbi:maker20 [Drosophila busckii]|uniref:Maker20 n=2 Tax=Drosophila busckii TaxID=30019 RepID=A0A0M5IX78_DROBS|nr:maker20 [Drosophila busckii]
MAFAAHEQRNYLAVLTASGIQVYSAGDTSILQFELEQVLHLELSEQPPQFCFAKLEKSKDLLLALSYEPLKSLHIYQHQGVAGFVPILASNTLQTLPLKLQLTATRDNELALVNGEDIYVLVPQFTKL